MIVRFKQLMYDELVEIQQVSIQSKDRPDVSNKFRKLFFFILREGVIRTLLKIHSKRNKATVLEKRKTLIIIKNDKKLYANFSTQTVVDPNEFVVINKFYFINDVFNIEDINDESKFNQFVTNKDKQEIAISLEKHSLSNNNVNLTKKGVFIYGLGDYSRVYIASNISKYEKSYCIDYNYTLSKYYKEKFKYNNFGLIPEESFFELKNTEKPLVIIATYHSDHTRIAKEIFDINPSTLIFIEKPPCVTLDDIKTLLSLYKQNANIEIGYNRRYININKKIRDLTYFQQKVITISVKEILINDNHWYFWDNQGTRVTGNLTHWIDLSVFWINGSPVEINVINSPSKDETITVSILFSEGSLVNITVSDKGNSLRGVQEHIEVRTQEETFFIEDYIKLIRLKKNGKKSSIHMLSRNKGHDAMYKHLGELYEGKSSFLYKKKDLIDTTVTTYYISEMYKKGIRNLRIEDKIKMFE